MNQTFLSWGDLDDVVSQTHVFAKAVTNIIDRTICIFVGVRSHAIHRQVLREVHLAKLAKLAPNARKNILGSTLTFFKVSSESGSTLVMKLVSVTA